MSKKEEFIKAKEEIIKSIEEGNSERQKRSLQKHRQELEALKKAPEEICNKYWKAFDPTQTGWMDHRGCLWQTLGEMGIL